MAGNRESIQTDVAREIGQPLATVLRISGAAFADIVRTLRPGREGEVGDDILARLVKHTQDVRLAPAITDNWAALTARRRGPRHRANRIGVDVVQRPDYPFPVCLMNCQALTERACSPEASSTGFYVHGPVSAEWYRQQMPSTRLPRGDPRQQQRRKDIDFEAESRTLTQGGKGAHTCHPSWQSDPRGQVKEAVNRKHQKAVIDLGW